MNQKTEPQAKATQKTRKKARSYIGLYVFIVLFFTVAFLSRHETVTTIDCTPEIIAGKPDIIMLGAWWCSYCYQAKKYFQKNSINYCEYDMENTATGRKLYQQYGSGAVPILLIGEYQLNGFSEQQIEAALNILNNSTK